MIRDLPVTSGSRFTGVGLVVDLNLDGIPVGFELVGTADTCRAIGVSTSALRVIANRVSGNVMRLPDDDECMYVTASHDDDIARRIVDTVTDAEVRFLFGEDQRIVGFEIRRPAFKPL
ncbi:MAG: hypothetical protein AAF432_09480 [Planctomycetota bacterium]